MKIADLFFPPRCPYCGAVIKSNERACNACLSLFPAAPFVRRLYGETCVAPFCYDGIFRKAVISFKFYNHPQYAKQFALAMHDAVGKELPDIQYDIVTCVPLSKKRKKERGYNQSYLLAKAFAKEINAPFVPALYKTRENLPQHSLPKNKRSGNVRGVYALCCPPKKITGKTVLLIDDIVTTGSTLHECSRILKETGAARVVCAAAASVE